MTITLDCYSIVGELRAKVSHLTKISERQLVLLTKDDELGMKEFSNDLSLVQDTFGDREFVEVIETPDLSLSNVDIHPSTLSHIPSMSLSSAQKIALIWANRVGIGTNSKIFGPFFSSVISRDASFRDIQAQLMETMKPILRDSCDLDVLNDSILFNLRVADTSCKYSHQIYYV